MFTIAFWKATAERSVRAFAATLTSLWLVGDTALDLRDIDWGSALSLGGGAALVSVLISLLAGAGLGPKGSPSLVRDPAAAGPVSEPVEPTPEPTNVHRRRVQREDLAEQLHRPEHRRDPDLSP